MDAFDNFIPNFFEIKYSIFLDTFLQKNGIVLVVPVDENACSSISSEYFQYFYESEFLADSMESSMFIRKLFIKSPGLPA
jgi:hypothetical protein